MRPTIAAALMATMLTTIAVAAPALRDVQHRELCVTLGAIEPAGAELVVNSAKMRAVLAERTDANAELRFTYLGPSEETSPLASGQLRRQIGLKLRALDGCNVVYVMYRIAPEARLVVSIKRNRGMRTHAECGARGYTNMKAEHSTAVPQPVPGRRYVLSAAIAQQRLIVSLDGAVVWNGVLGAAADELDGPVGVRSDNGRFAFVLRAPPRGAEVVPCRATREDGSDD